MRFHFPSRGSSSSAKSGPFMARISPDGDERRQVLEQHTGRATARAPAKEKDSLAFRAYSSQRLHTTRTFDNPSPAMSQVLRIFCERCREGSLQSGLQIAHTMPGSPPPEPTSMTAPLPGRNGTEQRQSRMCSLQSISGSLGPVRRISRMTPGRPCSGEGHPRRMKAVFERQVPQHFPFHSWTRFLTLYTFHRRKISFPITREG